MAPPPHRRGRIARFAHACVQQHLAGDLARVDVDDPRLAAWERSSATTAHRHAPVSLARWRTIPGGGNILALVLLDASEEIARVPRVQACVSSSRLVKRARASTGQRHGTSGQKIGHAHLQGAFSAAAVLLLKHTQPAQKSLATLATTPGTGKALSLLAHTLGRAGYCMRKHHVACDQAKFLAPSGWRDRPNLASHGRHRGKRHTPAAPHRALRLVGHEPAPAVPVPHGTPGIRWR